MIKRVTDTVYIGKFITFDKRVYPVELKTNNSYFWEVSNTKDGSSIGYIEWFKRWKKFCLFPYPDTVFEEVCLKDISDFIVERTKEKKELDKNA